MAEKIAGFILIGLAIIGLLIWSAWELHEHRQAKAEERKQRLIEKDHADNVMLNLFSLILEDDQLRNEQLVAMNAHKDETIEALNRKIQKMKDIASKCKLADLFQSAEEENA